MSTGIARLYSQHVRLRSGQAGLASFTESERDARLSDVSKLVESSLVGRREGDTNWREGFRRAGELLEWLSHPELNPEGLPLSLLGSAAYQLAGYPARAASLAAKNEDGEQDAPLIRLLLSGKFFELLPLAAQIASTRPASLDERLSGGEPSSQAASAYVSEVIAGELASALGVVCASMRWGDERRVERALEKLDAVAPALSHLADPFSWLVVRLASEVAKSSVRTSLRGAVTPLVERLGDEGRIALERYVRLACRSEQILTWPSQQRGFDRLIETGSFALCTPTGSGKTRVAEVALLNGLFRRPPGMFAAAPLCLYIVPTRALAAEVEGKLGAVLREVRGARAVTVTALYGGLDWAPSDDWLLADEPAVLVCTQEKAEALVRFFGDMIIERLELVIVDEAHEVQYSGGAAPIGSDSRSLRLETFISRLRARLPSADFIAMSAVARTIDRPLARWISGDAQSEAVAVPYRSTRQVVGRLHCQAHGASRIEYDLLDGEPIQVEARSAEGPYVPSPFPSMPDAPNLTGPYQRSSAHALWTAMQLAAGGGAGAAPQSVLVSLTEQISNFASWWLTLLGDEWPTAMLPDFFEPPQTEADQALWERALATCGDLFGTNSREYLLLTKGIVIHHGRMPGRLPRLLTQLVERQIIRIVLATSTLSQGVNLPVQTVLVPFLSRHSRDGEQRITGREFGNLVGRAGRPGVSTEGQTLVLLLDTMERWRRTRARANYDAVISELAGAGGDEDGAESPLAHLVSEVARLVPGGPDEVENWLEQTVPADLDTDTQNSAILALDALDAVLIAAMEDSNELEAEEQLRAFWQSSFARYASARESELEDLVLRRGRALAARIYPDAELRRRYYKTSLPPREAQKLLDMTPSLIAHLETGAEYARWNADERMQYVELAVELVGGMDRFRIPATIGASNATWQDALRWWFRVPDLTRVPTITQVAVWHDFLQRELRYKFTWGFGAALAVNANEHGVEGFFAADAGELPWASAWIKDLLTWGTLDPAAALLLARGIEYTRESAEERAAEYYAEKAAEPDQFDPVALNRWARTLVQNPFQDVGTERRRFSVELIEGVQAAGLRVPVRVLPSIHDAHIDWVDPGGFPLARSQGSGYFDEAWAIDQDFTLDVETYEIVTSSYLGM